jgi:hypothetical protein
MQVEEQTNLVDFQGSHKRPAFLYAMITFGMIPVEHYVAALRLARPLNCRMELMIDKLPSMKTVKSEEVGHARDLICREVLSYAIKPEFIFFFGDDMIPEWWHLVKLYEEAVANHWDVLSALYYVKQDEVPQPILWRENINGTLKENIHYQPGEVVISDIAGMDFTLIRPEILEKMTPPFFRSGLEPIPNMPDKYWMHTEDAWFCRKAKYEANAKVGVHTGVRVAHLDISTGEVY